MVLVDSTPARRPRAFARRIARGVAALTTPLLPDDYLGLVDPLWSASDLRARVVAVQPEAAGAATLVLRPGLGWTGHRAGQWVRVGVEVDGAVTGEGRGRSKKLAEQAAARSAIEARTNPPTETTTSAPPPSNEPPISAPPPGPGATE